MSSQDGVARRDFLKMSGGLVLGLSVLGQQKQSNQLTYPQLPSVLSSEWDVSGSRGSSENYSWAIKSAIDTNLKQKLQQETGLNFPPATFFSVHIDGIRPAGKDGCDGFPVSFDVPLTPVSVGPFCLPLNGGNGPASTAAEKADSLYQNQIQTWYDVSEMSKDEGLKSYEFSDIGDIPYNKQEYVIKSQTTYTFTHGESADLRGFLSIESNNGEATFLAVGGTFPDESEYGQGFDRMPLDQQERQSTLIDHMRNTSV